MSTYDYERYPPRSSSRTYIWPILLLLILGGVLIWRYWPQGGGGLDPDAMPRPVTARGDLAEDEKATIELYRRTAPSVVHITRLAVRRDFSLNIQQIPEGTGSGFVW